MSPLAEVRLVSAREVVKNLRGPKGVVLSSLSLAGGLLVALLANYQKAPRATVEELTQLHATARLPPDFDLPRASMLIAAPPALNLFLEMSVWLAPALIWLAGFDAISGEVQHRTVRYWAGRTRRHSYYAGKVVGLFTTIAAITFAMHLVVWIVTIVRGGGGLGETLVWGLRFWVATLPIVAAWCGIAAFVSSLFRAPLSSLLTTGLVFFTLFVVGAVVPKILVAATADPANATAKLLTFFYPNGYDTWVLHPEGRKVLVGLLACLGFVVVTSAAGVALHVRRDV